MRQETPTISIIIPTHNRSTALRRTLDALQKQNYSLNEIEVIVVADGCTDETLETIRGYHAPFSFHFIEQACQGAAVARNQGAIAAKGRLLLFLDDDIEAAPGLIKAHVAAHQASNQVVIGYLPPILNYQTGFFQVVLRGWWESMFQTMRQMGHRYSYHDLLSGNFSLSKALFAQVGGFDAAFRCQEDYELGVRLLQAGAQFTFVADAWGYHHEMSSLERSLQRKYQEGRASVQLGRKHPELIPTLPVFHYEDNFSTFNRILLQFIFQLSIVYDLFAVGCHYLLNLLEWLRIRGFWQKLLDRLLKYWYLRGVAEELGSRQALTNFLHSQPVPSNRKEPELQLNLKAGLTMVEQQLDQKRPLSVCIYYGQHFVAHFPSQPGAEPLRAAHLRPMLATRASSSLLGALVLDGAIEPHILSKPLLENLDGVQTQQAEVLPANSELIELSRVN
jgi:glycosyltransferase involved in cell wall biosynthesis